MQASPEAEEQVGALFALATSRTLHPELGHEESQARLTLAAAIMEMDEAMQSGPAIHQQANVNEATTAYAQSLANLLRGQASD